ncbi:MAG: IS701 family transposase [Ignavibacteriaceae bacterium]
MNVLGSAVSYLKGLFLTEKSKRNIERMSDQLGGNYQKDHHFISDSPWDGKEAMKIVAKKTNVALGPFEKQGLMIDESSTKKSGKKSVGVSRQHNGNLGKIENSQTGVYASLSTNEKVCLVNARLYLPEEWTNDKERCLKVGVPLKDICYKTKPQLALDIIDDLDQQGIKYGWIGADGLYGASTEFKNQLDIRDKKYVLDIHCDQHVFTEEPEIFIPPKSTGKGRKFTKLITTKKSVEARKYKQTLGNEDYRPVRIRKGTKGWILANVHVTQIYTWDKKSDKAIEKTLIITTRNSGETKYSISSFTIQEKTPEEFAYMQSQRHWIERAFQDSKSDLGLTEYQVRKYHAWYHHQALVMMAMNYVLLLKIERQEDLPILSTADVRYQIMAALKNKGANLGQEMEKMLKRHNQRTKDINRYYPNNEYFMSDS